MLWYCIKYRRLVGYKLSLRNVSAWRRVIGFEACLESLVFYLFIRTRGFVLNMKLALFVFVFELPTVKRHFVLLTRKTTTYIT